MFDKIMTFLIVSSANPKKTSASLKGPLIAIVGVASIFMGQDVPLTPLVEQAVAVVNAALVLFGALYGFFGIVRKIYRTVNGDNEAMKVYE